MQDHDDMVDFLDRQFSEFSIVDRHARSNQMVGSAVDQHSRLYLNPAKSSSCACAEHQQNCTMDVSNLDDHTMPLSPRVVLSFQHKLGEGMLVRWIEEYNERTGRKLKWTEALPNNLHMIHIEDDNPESVLEQLIAESPLQSAGTFAAVNRYNPTFHSDRPKSLRQIVTVLISNQFLFNQLVFNLADLILAPVGKVVGKQLRKHRRGTRIEAVVETCRDSFVTEIEVPLLDTQTLLLELDYLGGPSSAQSRTFLDKAKDCLSSLKPKKRAPHCGSCFHKEKSTISIDC